MIRFCDFVLVLAQGGEVNDSAFTEVGKDLIPALQL